MNKKNEIFHACNKIIKCKQVLEILHSALNELLANISKQVMQELLVSFNKASFYQNYFKNVSSIYENLAIEIMNTKNWFFANNMSFSNSFKELNIGNNKKENSNNSNSINISESNPNNSNINIINSSRSSTNSKRSNKDNKENGKEEINVNKGDNKEVKDKAQNTEHKDFKEKETKKHNKLTEDQQASSKKELSSDNKVSLVTDTKFIELNQQLSQNEKKTSEHFFLLSKELKKSFCSINLQEIKSKFTKIREEQEQNSAFNQQSFHKFIEVFNKNIESYVNNFKKNYSNNQELEHLLKENDVYQVSYQAAKMINECIDKTNAFLEIYYSFLVKLSHLSYNFFNFMKVLAISYKELIRKFVNVEEKKIIGGDAEIKTDSKVEDTSSKDIINTNRDETTVLINIDEINFDSFFNTSTKWIDLLEINSFSTIKQTLVKSKENSNTNNSIISNNANNPETCNKFLINIDTLMSVIRQLIPKKQDFIKEFNLKNFSMTVLRNKGMFSEWQEIELIQSISGNILIFDNKKEDKVVNVFPMNKSTINFNMKNKNEFSISKPKEGFLSKYYNKEDFKIKNEIDILELDKLSKELTRIKSINNEKMESKKDNKDLNSEVNKEAQSDLKTEDNKKNNDNKPEDTNIVETKKNNKDNDDEADKIEENQKSSNENNIDICNTPSDIVGNTIKESIQ